MVEYKKEKPVRIWVDGQCFQTASNVRGIGRYVADLLVAIHATGRTNLVVSLNGNMKEEAIAARNYLNRLIPGIEIAIWYGLTPDGEVRRGYCTERMTDEHILVSHVNSLSPDVALSPSPFEGSWDRSSPFLRTSGVNALTACIFHDAIPHRFPSAYLSDDGERKSYYRRLEAIKNFDTVLCNSDFTKSEYVDIFRKENAFSIGAGLSPVFAQLLSEGRQGQDYLQNIGPYVLYVGGMDWRKNVTTLLRAMVKVPDVLTGDLKLVIAGDNGAQYINPLRQMWQKFGLDPNGLISTGWISDQQLAALYQRAAVTVQPSLMEGFGLTALEAMAAGSPFLSARGGAVAEIVDNEDQLFDPHDPRDLAVKITKVLTDKVFCSSIIEYGYERAKEFRWDRTAELSISALEDGLGEGGVQLLAAPGPQSYSGRRLLMDVSSTLQSPVMSGIQRVMHRLANAMSELNSRSGFPNTQLTYCRDELGWYGIEKVSKDRISLCPTSRLNFSSQDSYFLLDSSWTFIDGQKRRLLDALVMGQQEVVHGIHDIGPLTMSAFTDSGMPPAFRKWFEFVLGYSTGIICVSRAVADEVYALIEAIELPRPMKVGYFSLGGDFSDAAHETDWLSFTEGRPTFLMVGTIEPRKAHWVALDAFERLWADGKDINLLIIGKSGWDTLLLRSRLAHHPEAEKRLFVRTGVSDGQLRGAYISAQALIMTSYLEGFGLPVAEAGSAGCPVILADIPVFREVGDAAPAVKYFEQRSPEDLARCVQDVIQGGFEQVSKVDTWPNWLESAEQVHDIIFGGKWYKHYEPREVLPNTKLSDIGKVMMTAPLDSNTSKHTLSCIEGPLFSEDGTELRFVVSLRNDSSIVWSSYGSSGGGFDVNVGSHIYADNGACLDFENPRAHIPFVISPGQEICLPVRVSSDWLARGARFVGVELVQEGVSWFGERLRLDLLQPPSAAKAEQRVDCSEGEASKISLVLIRKGFSVVDEDEKYFIFMIYNSASEAVFFNSLGGVSGMSTAALDIDGQEIGSGHIVASCSHVDANGYSLLCLAFASHMLSRSSMLSIKISAHSDAEWMLDLATNEVSRVGGQHGAFHEADPVSEPVSRVESYKDKNASNFSEINVDSYDDLGDDEFCTSMYSVLLSREIDESGLKFYRWALATKRLTRLGAVRRIIRDNGIGLIWKVFSVKPERNEICIPGLREKNPEQVLNTVESTLGIKVPTHVSERWLSGRINIDDLISEVQQTMDPFFYKVSLDVLAGD